MFFTALLLSSCKDEDKPVTPKKAVTEVTCIENNLSKADDKQITLLIRKVLTWANSDDSFELLPFNEGTDSLCTGINFRQHNENLNKLKETGYFTEVFISNYDNIVKTIDKQIKNKTIEPWNVYEEPPLRFDTGASAWCMCQDNSDWGKVETEAIGIYDDESEFYWKFGGLQPDDDPSWKAFRYKFKAAIKNGKWKIDWMEGFDYESSTKSDGM